MSVGHGTPLAALRVVVKSAKPRTQTSGPSHARIGRYVPELNLLIIEGVTIGVATNVLHVRFHSDMGRVLADRRNRVVCPPGPPLGP
jgi:hypothetical protein